MALNEMIAQGAQFNMPDPIAQYNKLAQMQQYQSQNELNRQEALDKATERQRVVSERTKRSAFLTQFSEKLAERGVELNKQTVAGMISSGVPEIEKLGFEALKAMQSDESYNAAMGGAPAAATPMAAGPMTAAPASATAVTYDSMQPNLIGDVAPGTAISLPTEKARRFNAVTSNFDLVPDKDQTLARGQFNPLTKTYLPYNSSVTLSTPEILNKLSNRLADLTNNANLTPQNREEMQAIKEEIIRITPNNTMTLQAPAATVSNAMVAPAPAPAAPTVELAKLIHQRNRLSRLRPENSGDVARLKNTLDGIDKQIEVLNRQDPDPVRIARAIAATIAPPGTPENLAAYNKALKEQSDKSKAEIVKVIGVAAGTKNPVYLDVNTDEQYTYVVGADGKQTRKLYSGGVDRSTSNVTATATTGPVGKSLSEPVGKRVEASLVKAEGATSMMDTANSVREALNAGNVIAGPLANVRTKFAQLLELAGAGDKEKLVNTRTAIQGLAGLTLESRAELRGQGQITDTETKLLEKARSADVGDLTIPELQQVVNVSQRLASRLYGNHQTLLDRMKDDPAAKDSMRYYEPTSKLSSPLLEGKTSAAQSKDEKRPSLGSIFGNPSQGVK